MYNSLQVILKYSIIFLFALFVLVSFLAQTEGSDERKRGRYALQGIFIVLIHAAAFICIFLNIADGTVRSFTMKDALILYGVQLLYLLLMLILLPKLIRLSRGINSVMCMFLTIGFFMQARLNFQLAKKQFIYLLIASAVFIVFQFLYKFIKGMYRLTWAYCAAGIILILIVLIFAQIDAGAKIAIDFGFISFQPFEFVKILFVLFIAGAFNKANSFKTVAITALFAAVHIFLMVICTELGTALMLFVVYILMLYVATRKFRYILIGGGAFIAACVAAYFLFSHVRTRITVWLDPFADIDNRGYQLTQSLFAIGSGGWFGTGLFKGSPGYVPMVTNDFVFSAICEELGLVFAIFLIMLTLCMVLMILKVAIRIDEPFNKMTAFGLGCTFGFQIFLTVGGAIRLIPSTGVNFPFISSGGSSLLASMLIIGIVQGLYIVSEKDVQFEREIIAEEIMYLKDGREAELFRLSEDEEPEEMYISEGRIVKVNPDKDTDEHRKES